MYSNTPLIPKTVAVAARGQMRIRLGSFANNYNLKGFSVHIKPESLSDGDVSTQVVRIDNTDGYSMYMNVVNYSDKAIHLHIDEV